MSPGLFSTILNSYCCETIILTYSSIPQLFLATAHPVLTVALKVIPQILPDGNVVQNSTWPQEMRILYV
jgi:hypothetical protein